jgi:tetratricopeptide (TPR) repeat protein
VGFARAEDSAQRALSLDPNNVSALLTLGSVALFARWDFEEARVWFARARDVGPGLASPLNALGFWNGMLGRREAARSLFQRAADRDPLQLVYLAHLAYTNYTTGRFEFAKLQVEAIENIDPASNLYLFHSGWLEWHQGNFEQALVYADQRPGSHGLTACSLHRLGRFTEAQAALEELKPDNPHALAAAHSCWGDADEAFVWLERAFEQRSPELIALRGNFIFEPLHDDPRWQTLLRKVGITDEQIAEFEE